MKQFIRVQMVVIAFLLSFFAFSSSSYADVNVDSGGGSLEGGSSSNYWSAGRDGVRITVVRAEDGAVMTTPIDFSNYTNDDVDYHFGYGSKIQYVNGKSLSVFESKYQSCKFGMSLPHIVADDSYATNIEDIRNFFRRETTIVEIANLTGIPYDTLTNGKYKLLMEPIVYLVFMDDTYAMTATEAALFDQMGSGILRSYFVDLSHKNLPLSMFLETSDLGFPAWSGANARQGNTTIISSLGLGIIKFSEDEEEPPVIPYDVTYRTDTDVITSVMVSSAVERNPEDPVTVQFNINGTVYEHKDIYLPEGEEQLAWVKWTTPSDPGVINISVNSNATVDTNMIVANIEDLTDKEPPDPKGTDRNDGFSTPSIPSFADVTNLTWGEWKSWYHAVWVDNGAYYSKSEYNSHLDTPIPDTALDAIFATTDKAWISKWEDEGYYMFEWIPYEASLISTDMSIKPSDKSPTASGKKMKSGYGFTMNADGRIVSNADYTDFTHVGNTIAYFPEFEYTYYCRLLERMTTGLSGYFEFYNNKYSTFNERVHFTPVWFKDGAYTPIVLIRDAWTPAGELKVQLSDTITISGSVYDDWHVKPVIVD